MINVLGKKTFKQWNYTTPNVKVRVQEKIFVQWSFTILNIKVKVCGIHAMKLHDT
jgi:hypothetical protein